jgi:predicted Zn finger-like uncharacterized protein
MALATTCPQCKTSFKVVPDQLKLRRGLVRCGMCQHVFSGVDFLRYVDESKRGAAHDAGPREQAGAEGNLETAFFLPETILAAPPRTHGDAGPPHAHDPAGAGADAPIVGTTDNDLLALGHEPPPPDVRQDPLPGPVDAPSIDWPGAQIDWQHDPTLPLPPDSRDPADDTPAGAGASDDVPADTGRPDDTPADAGRADGEVDTALPQEQAPVPPEPAPWAAPWDTGTPPEPEWGQAPEPMPEPALQGHDEERERAPLDEWHEEIESLTATAAAGFPGSGHDDGMDGEARERAHRPAVAAPAVPGMPEAPDAGGGFAASWRREHDPSVHDDEEPVIDYFSSGRRGIGFVDRHGPVALLGAALLVVLLGVQWAIAQRSMIAARVPALAPAMSALLSPFGLAVGPPRDLESLTIESFELQASTTPGVLAMSALLRNRADYAVQWPSMQLTLTDTANRVLVRKVLLPADYLRDTGGDGVPARAEWPVRMALEAKDLHPAGYSVVLFYP